MMTMVSVITTATRWSSGVKRFRGKINHITNIRDSSVGLLGRPMKRVMENICSDPRMDTSGVRKGPVAASCEHSTGHSQSINRHFSPT